MGCVRSPLCTLVPMGRRLSLEEKRWAECRAWDLSFSSPSPTESIARSYLGNVRQGTRGLGSYSGPSFPWLTLPCTPAVADLLSSILQRPNSIRKPLGCLLILPPNADLVGMV